MKARLVQRFRGMAIMEIANIAICAFAALSVCWAFESRLPSAGAWAGLASMSWLLVQAGVYWKWKADALEGKAGPFPRARFRRWKRTNPLVIAVAGLLVVALSRTSDLWIGGIAWTMAILEHVNYYRVQLMHDTTNDWSRLLRDRRLRASSLAKDMRAADRPNEAAKSDR